jgi:hypothetical protein
MGSLTHPSSADLRPLYRGERSWRSLEYSTTPALAHSPRRCRGGMPRQTGENCAVLRAYAKFGARSSAGVPAFSRRRVMNTEAPYTSHTTDPLYHFSHCMLVPPKYIVAISPNRCTRDRARHSLPFCTRQIVIKDTLSCIVGGAAGVLRQSRICMARAKGIQPCLILVLPRGVVMVSPATRRLADSGVLLLGNRDPLENSHQGS